MNNEVMTTMITEYVASYRDLTRAEYGWRQPVIGFARAADPLFKTLKERISPSHLLPTDLLADAQSVVVFFIPFDKVVIDSNVGGDESSRQWDLCTIETNQLLADLSKHIYEKISAMGHSCVPLPATYNYDKDKLISDWSQRHAGYIAGIGTFGVNNMLITEQGCCGRIGSIITDLLFEPGTKSPIENCLYKYNGTCRKCVERCVNYALSITDEPVYDRYKCNDQIYNGHVPVYTSGLGDTCGKCLCGLPCSVQNPRKSAIRG
jgi:epoxyqueuosine reductase QueG